MAMRQVVFPAIAVLAMVAGCSEKADEPAARVPPGAVGEPVRSGPASIPGIPEEAHFASAEFDAEAIAGKLTSGACRLENVVTVPDERPGATDSPARFQVDTATGFRIVGFVVDKDAMRVPPRLDMVLTGPGSYSVPVHTGRPRGDVAEYFDTPGFAEAGFLEDIAFARVEPGDYTVYFVDQETGSACSPGQTITVAE